MKFIRVLIPAVFLAAFVAIGLSRNANSALPWAGVGTAVNYAATGTASPTCTSFANTPVCVLTMTANVTSLTISGDPGAATNHMATLIMVQDGTGSRVFPSAVASLTSTLLPSPASTAANKYTAYVLQFNTTTSKYSVIQQYDNYPVAGFEFQTVQSAAAATIAPASTLALTAQEAPGMTANNTCLCVSNQATNGVVQFYCVPGTNTVQCVEYNPNGAATVTATTTTLNIRGLP